MEQGCNSLKEISGGATLFLVGILLSKLITYFYRLVVARTLGPEGYGLITISLAVVGLISSMLLLGLPQGILRYVPYFKAKGMNLKATRLISFVIKLTLLFSLIAAISLFFLSEYIAIRFFHEPALIILLKIFSFSIPLFILSDVIEKSLQAFKKVKYIMLVRGIFESGSRLILAMLALWLGYKVAGVSIMYVISLLIGAILFFWFLTKKTQGIGKLFLGSFSAKKELLSFSLPLFLYEICVLLLLWTDTLLIGHYRGAYQAGVYDIGLATSRLIHVIPAALVVLFVPVVSSAYAVGNEIKTVYRTVTKWIFISTVPLLALFSFFPKQILNIFFGQEYTSGYAVLIIISIAHFLTGLNLTSHNILLVLKKTKLIFMDILLAVVSNVFLNILLIPSYGIVGAAIATSIALLLEVILIESQAYYFTKINPFKTSCAKSALAGIVSVVIVYFIKERFNINNIILLFLLFFIFSLGYVFLLLVMKAFDKEDKLFLEAVQEKTKIKLKFLERILDRFS